MESVADVDFTSNRYALRAVILAVDTRNRKLMEATLMCLNQDTVERINNWFAALEGAEEAMEAKRGTIEDEEKPETT